MRKLFAKNRKCLLKKDAEMYIDTAVGMIIAVVVGALLLAGLYAIFNDTLLPGLAERIQNMFGSTGGTPIPGGQVIVI